MAFPNGDVKSEKELEKYIDEQIAKELSRESENLFAMEVSVFAREKANLQMPEAFLKRWLVTINEGRFTLEDIEKDFEGFIKMFTWNYIQKRIIEANEITITPEDALAEAKSVAQMQLAQYGMGVAPDDMLENYGKQILSNKEQSQKIYEVMFEKKVVEAIKEKITVKEKAITLEAFGKVIEDLQKR